MKQTDVTTLSAVDIAKAVESGAMSAESIVRGLLGRIEAREAVVHAWQALDAELALEQARAVDRGNRRGLLSGVPLAVKDILDTADLPTRYGSAIYDGFRPRADASCVALSRTAGAVVMGKTVTTEFAYFSPGPTANPRNPAHTPGGSSSGSAAAVADGMVPLAFGTQTAGSLIRPASYCGVFGFKPTHGAFSLAGGKAFAPSLDTLGWLARSANDLELMRAALSGERFEPLPEPRAGELRIGVCHTHEWSLVEPAGAEAFDTAMRKLAAAGVDGELVTLLDPFDRLVDAQKTVMAYEAARSLAHERLAHADRLSEALRTLLDTGVRCAREAYDEAQDLAVQGREILSDCMLDYDALLVPAAPGEAPAGLAATGDPVFSRVWTLLGVPCVSVPGLLGPRDLPIGMQLIAAPRAERKLLAIAGWLHRALA